jgi:4'-phosphopantetheinyl transferase
MWSNNNSDIGVLYAGTVHVWRASLVCDESELHRYEKILSREEIASAHRFVKKTDQIKSILSKAILRSVLSKYLAISAEKLVFSVGEKGKPFVAETDIQFNVSHSGDYLLVAVMRDQAIGVDVECVKSNKDFLAIAERFFAPSEVGAIRRDENPVAAFYRCWTRKEAFVKATGLGLSFPLHDFEVDVSANPVGDSCLMSVQDVAYVASEWTLRPIALSELYFGAVASHGMIKQISYYNFTHDFC